MTIGVLCWTLMVSAVELPPGCSKTGLTCHQLAGDLADAECQDWQANTACFRGICVSPASCKMFATPPSTSATLPSTSATFASSLPTTTLNSPNTPSSPTRSTTSSTTTTTTTARCPAEVSARCLPLCSARGRASCIDGACVCNVGYCAQGYSCQPDPDYVAPANATATLDPSCVRVTGECDSFCGLRGRAWCIEGKCTCRDGFCAQNGDCVPREGSPAPKGKTLDNRSCAVATGNCGLFCGASGKATCANGQCCCRRNYCAAREGIKSWWGACTEAEQVVLSASPAVFPLPSLAALACALIGISLSLRRRRRGSAAAEPLLSLA